MLLLPAPPFAPSARSREKAAEALRLRDVSPASYAREYQVPDAPRANLLNKHCAPAEPLLLCFRADREAPPAIALSRPRALAQLFLDCPARAAPPPPIMRTAQSVAPRAPLPDAQHLRSLLQLLGVEAQDEEAFAGEALLLLERGGRRKAARALRSARRAVEVLHRFRVCSQGGKSRVVLPVSHKEAADEEGARRAAAVSPFASLSALLRAERPLGRRAPVVLAVDEDTPPPSKRVKEE